MTPTNRKKLAEIAAKNIPELMGRKDLNRHFTDAADFFETSVWSLEAALIEAFEYGEEMGAKTGRVAEPKNYHGDL